MPADADRRPLSFAELTAVLGALEGEQLIVRADASVEAEAASGPPGLSFIGRLAVDRSVGDVTELSFGDPGAAPVGRLRIPAAALCEATLSTYDGNDFVIVRMRMPGLSIHVQDESSGAL